MSNSCNASHLKWNEFSISFLNCTKMPIPFTDESSLVFQGVTDNVWKIPIMCHLSATLSTNQHHKSNMSIPSSWNWHNAKKKTVEKICGLRAPTNQTIWIKIKPKKPIYLQLNWLKVKFDARRMLVKCQ